MARYEVRPPNRRSGAPLPQTVEICRVDGLGDILFMEPTIRHLRARTPSLQVILRTCPAFQVLGELIGATITEVEPDKTRSPEHCDYNWALERHVGSYSLDRVSMWETIFDVPIGWNDVRVDLDAFCARHPEDRVELPPSNKPTLHIAPFAAHPGRSLSSRALLEWLPSLSRQYRVVLSLLPSHTVDDDVERYALVYRGLSLAQYIHIVQQSDKVLATDTGGLYLAAAGGKPCVGIYEHVAPWLRCRRVPNILAWYVRQNDCACDMHGPCTKVLQGGVEPCKLHLDPDLVLQAIQRANVGGSRYVDRNLHPTSAARIAVIVPPQGNPQRQQEMVEYAFAGIPHIVVDTMQGVSDVRYVLALQPGWSFTRQDVWLALDDLNRPGSQKGLDDWLIPYRLPIVPWTYILHDRTPIQWHCSHRSDLIPANVIETRWGSGRVVQPDSEFGPHDVLIIWGVVPTDPGLRRALANAVAMGVRLEVRDLREVVPGDVSLLRAAAIVHTTNESVAKQVEGHGIGVRVGRVGLTLYTPSRQHPILRPSAVLRSGDPSRLSTTTAKEIGQ